MERHIPDGLLGRFFRNETELEEAREVVRHLLTRCPRCTNLATRKARELGIFGAAANVDQAYEEVFARALSFGTEQAERLAVERLRAWGLWASLEPLAPHVRLSALETDPAFHTFGLYDRLLEASRGYIRTDPAEAVDVVRLAIVVAERLDPARHLLQKRSAFLSGGGSSAIRRPQTSPPQ